MGIRIYAEMGVAHYSVGASRGRTLCRMFLVWDAPYAIAVCMEMPFTKTPRSQCTSVTRETDKEDTVLHQFSVACKQMNVSGTDRFV